MCPTCHSRHRLCAVLSDSGPAVRAGRLLEEAREQVDQRLREAQLPLQLVQAAVQGGGRGGGGSSGGDAEQGLQHATPQTLHTSFPFVYTYGAKSEETLVVPNPADLVEGTGAKTKLKVLYNGQKVADILREMGRTLEVCPALYLKMAAAVFQE